MFAASPTTVFNRQKWNDAREIVRKGRRYVNVQKEIKDSNCCQYDKFRDLGFWVTS